MGQRLKNETTQTDLLSGRRVTTSKTYNIKMPEQDSFYMSYFKNMGSFHQLTKGIDFNVMTTMCEMAVYNTGEILIPIQTRLALIKKLSISSSQLSRSIAKLKELDLILGDKGRYFINPAIFWKGTNAERQKLLDAGGGLYLTVRIGKKNKDEIDNLYE